MDNKEKNIQENKVVIYPKPSKEELKALREYKKLINKMKKK